MVSTRSCEGFTARRYASAVYAVFVYLSVRLLQAGAVPKRLKIGSRKQHDSPRTL